MHGAQLSFTQEAESKFIPRKKIYINGKLNKKLSVKFDRKTLIYQGPGLYGL